MNTRNHLRSFLFAVTTASVSLLLQPVAFAADPPKPTEPKPAVQAMDHEKTMDHEKKCKKYVREHHGHPGKGVDVVKVVYVECPQKR